MVYVGFYVLVVGIVGLGFGIVYVYLIVVFSGWFLDVMVGLYEVLLVILLLLILIYVVGVLWYKVVCCDGVLESMMGWFL